MAGSPYVTSNDRPAGRTISAPAAQNSDAINQRLDEIETDVLTVQSDITALEVDVSDVVADVADHETRIVALEGA
jgi:outer membrane murein-binding lipoprotein Lpp